jgi:hypothetical protein
MQSRNGFTPHGLRILEYVGIAGILVSIIVFLVLWKSTEVSTTVVLWISVVAVSLKKLVQARTLLGVEAVPLAIRVRAFAVLGAAFLVTMGLLLRWLAQRFLD